MSDPTPPPAALTQAATRYSKADLDRLRNMIAKRRATGGSEWSNPLTCAEVLNLIEQAEATLSVATPAPAPAAEATAAAAGWHQLTDAPPPDVTVLVDADHDYGKPDTFTATCHSADRSKTFRSNLDGKALKNPRRWRLLPIDAREADAARARRLEVLLVEVREYLPELSAMLPEAVSDRERWIPDLIERIDAALAPLPPQGPSAAGGDATEGMRKALADEVRNYPCMMGDPTVWRGWHLACESIADQLIATTPLLGDAGGGGRGQG